MVYLIPCLSVSSNIGVKTMHLEGLPLRTHVSVHSILHKTTNIFFKFKDIPPNIDVNFALKIRSTATDINQLEKTSAL